MSINKTNHRENPYQHFSPFDHTLSIIFKLILFLQNFKKVNHDLVLIKLTIFGIGKYEI